MHRQSMALLILGAIVIGGLVSYGGRSIAERGISDAHAQVDTTRPPLVGLVQLVVTPPNLRLTVSRFSGPRIQDYHVTGTFAGQPDRDVTKEVNWKIDNGTIGAIAPSGVFTTSNRTGGQGIITAYSGSTTATAQISIVDVSTRIPDSIPDNATR